MKIALVQMALAWEDADANLKSAANLIANCVSAGANFVILPEMFICGFCAPVGKQAENYAKEGQRFLLEQATRHRIWIAGSVPSLAHGATLTNRLYLYTPTGEHLFYDKSHLFALSAEASNYQAGTDGMVTTVVNGVRCSFSICYDLRFPYLFWHRAQHSDLFIVVANWPMSRAHHWRTLLMARAIENQCYVAGVNITGEGGGARYSGGSLLIGPDGEVILDCGSEPGVYTAGVDPLRVEEYRYSYPFLASRQEF